MVVPFTVQNTFLVSRCEFSDINGIGAFGGGCHANRRGAPQVAWVSGVPP